MKPISIDTMLDQMPDSLSRAALHAGWELGKGLHDDPRPRKQLMSEIQNAAQTIGEDMDIEPAIVYAAALLSMALGQ